MKCLMAPVSLGGPLLGPSWLLGRNEDVLGTSGGPVLEARPELGPHLILV